MAKRFPLSWYWKADDGRIYSAKDQAVVTADDPGYKEFLASGHGPTRWPTETDYKTQTDATLLEVISKYGLRVNLADMLEKYAQDMHDTIAHGGISVNVSPAGKSPLIVGVSTSLKGLTLLHGLYVLAQKNPAYTASWQQPDGTSVKLSATQIDTIYCAAMAHIQGCFATQNGVRAAIKVGEITTKVQVDNPPSPIQVWPTNS